MKVNSPEISIIIPAKNGAPRIDRVLRAIFAQKTSFTYEVIVVDSGSEDETLQLVQRHPVRLYQISPEDFSHSKTRNYGAQLSQASRYIVFINQDAVPCGELWMEKLVESIEFEPGIKAMCATELIESKTYYSISGVAFCVFRNANTRGVHVIAPHILEKLPDLPKWQRRELFPFTTVCAIFDRGHFMDHPFDENVPWAEDLHWAVRNSREGYASGCTSLACVYHHHIYKLSERLAIRARTIRICKELFGSSIVDPHMHSILNAVINWNITLPLRRAYSFIMHLCTRNRNVQ